QQVPGAVRPVIAVEVRAEIGHRMHHGACAALLAPLVELADLLLADVAGLGADELRVIGVVVRCVAAPVGVDVVPVLRQQKVQFLRGQQAFGAVHQLVTPVSRPALVRSRPAVSGSRKVAMMAQPIASEAMISMPMLMRTSSTAAVKVTPMMNTPVSARPRL